MGSTPDMPMYEEYADTPFITRNRELNPMAYDYLTRAMENLDLYNANPEAYQAVADAYTQAQWNDFNRGYNEAMNQQAANNYNRLGTSNATSNLYTTDSTQRRMNDLASRIAANTASQYNNLVNQEYQRRLGSLGTYANLFNNSGAITEDVDMTNWGIRNENKDRQYMNDVNDYNKKMGMIGGTIQGLSSIGGAVAGGIFGGPAGAMLGGQLGSSMGQAVNNAIGATPMDTSSLPQSFANFGGSLGTRSGYSQGGGLNLNNNYSLPVTQLTGSYSDLINSGQPISGGTLRQLWS